MPKLKGVHQWRRYNIGMTAFETMLVQGSRFEVVDGVPADARLMQIGYDPQRLSCFAIFEHSSFDPIPDGNAYFSHGVQLRVLDPPAPESNRKFRFEQEESDAEK